MPESNKMAKKRIQKANKAAGIGDENGRIVRVKEPPKMSRCTVCQMELKITKTNTELTAHATSKHGKPLDECFPGAAATAAEMLAATNAHRAGGAPSGPSKAEKKKKDAAGLDDLLSAGLEAGPGKKKGSRK